MTKAKSNSLTVKRRNQIARAYLSMRSLKTRLKQADLWTKNPFENIILHYVNFGEVTLGLEVIKGSPQKLIKQFSTQKLIVTQAEATLFIIDLLEALVNKHIDILKQSIQV